MSMLPLIARLVVQTRVMLTTGTLTSAQLAASRLPENTFHQFIPVDTHAAVSRFLDHWRPDLGIFCESELWPNLMMAAFERRIPLGIVNGRMSARSFAGWSRVRGTISALLTPLAFCLGQSEADVTRFAALGAPAKSSGNLKFDVPALPFDAAELSALRDAIAGRAVFLAASTHPGEEELILSAMAPVRQQHPDILGIIVPRHPQRGEEIGAMIERLDGPVRRRSQGERPDAQARYYIADTLGELGLFFSLADIAFMGGSLVAHGGHNPIEPARHRAAVLTGPQWDNFDIAYKAMLAVGGAREVRSGAELAAEVKRLLDQPEALAAMQTAGARAVDRLTGALPRTVTALLTLLPSESTLAEPH